MSLYDITSANSVVTLTVANFSFIPSPVRLEDFTMENAAALNNIQVTETKMTLQGNLAAGYVPTPKTLTFNFSAGSPSYEILSNLYETMDLLQTIYKCDLQIKLPSRNIRFNFIDGVLKTMKGMPDLTRTLGDPSVEFEFSKMIKEKLA